MTVMNGGSQETPRPLKLGGHVGFDSLPDQLVNKSVQSGFSFNILSIGETGVGKSTLADSLFNTSFDSAAESHSEAGVRLKAHTYELQESNVNLKLTLVDTVGYGDQINKQDSFGSIVDYIDSQFEAYLQEELKIKRNLPGYHDSRVHVCLYFITPNGHGLKSIDLVCMKKLDQKVNIIPIIAKADTINKAELAKFKSKIMNELKSNGVSIYQFPLDDETVAEANKENNQHLPFAVVGSNEFVKVGLGSKAICLCLIEHSKLQVGSKEVRARQYPWGVVQVTACMVHQVLISDCCKEKSILPRIPSKSMATNIIYIPRPNPVSLFANCALLLKVENENHCDFTKLREMLIRTNMEDLCDSTHSRHYELYRKERLKQMGFEEGDKEGKVGAFVWEHQE